MPYSFVHRTSHIAGTLCGAAVIAAGFAFTKDSAPDAPVEPATTQAAAICTVKGDVTKLPPVLSEASGMTVGSTGIFWMHNDGNAAELFAIDRAGKELAVVRINAKITDFESIDAAPCSTGNCLYIGDIGDNNASRSDVVVFRVQEPVVGGAKSVSAEALHARYPDGPRDAEAFFVTRDGSAYIISKGDGGPIAVYRFSVAAAANAVATLTRVRVLTEGNIAQKDWVTDADISPDGEWIALRTRGYIDFYRTRDFLGNGKPAHRMDLGLLKEAQGEGVTFGSSARTVFVNSEGGQKGKGGLFAELACGL